MAEKSQKKSQKKKPKKFQLTDLTGKNNGKNREI